MIVTTSFQRARRPEQLEARRSAILAAAREALAGKTVTDITLGDISERVGLAKSNVLRYFDSREAILLEVLDDECRSWLSELEHSLGRPRPRKANYTTEIRVANAVSDSLAERELLCDLLAAMAGVLERNISIEFARDFKIRTAENLVTLTRLIDQQLPWNGADSAAFFAEAALGFAAGTYPFANPTEPVRQAMNELGFPEPRRRFTEGLRTGLATWLIGAGAQNPP